ncbi:MAG: acyl-CoA dehydrogenase family protein, partial [Cycloclasticus sp.]
MPFNTRINDEVDELRDAVRKFADGEIAPLAESVDQKNEFPNELWPVFGEMGLLGMTIPEEYGGTGLNYLSHLVVMEELSRASASIGLSYGANSNLCLNNLYLNGTEEQRHKYLPKLCRG